MAGDEIDAYDAERLEHEERERKSGRREISDWAWRLAEQQERAERDRRDKARRKTQMVQQLNLRRVGGSDAAAILDLSPYATPFDVWARITHGTKQEETRSMRRGRVFERAGADWWAREAGNVSDLTWFERSIEIPDRPWQRVSPDFRFLRTTPKPHWCLGDMKTQSAWSPQRHGAKGTDQIAPYETIQLTTYVEAMRHLWAIEGAQYVWAQDLDAATLVVFNMGNDSFKEYEIAYETKLGERIVEACERFWRDHVLTGNPPSLEGSHNAPEWIAQRWPEAKHPHRKAEGDEVELFDRYRRAKEEQGKAEAQVQTLEVQLKEKIADAGGLLFPSGVIHWSHVPETTGIDWEAVAKSLQGHITPTEWTELLNNKTKTTRKAYRRFVAKFGEEAAA